MVTQGNPARRMEGQGNPTAKWKDSKWSHSLKLTVSNCPIIGIRMINQKSYRDEVLPTNLSRQGAHDDIVTRYG